ncbi:MAG: 3-dehydroquinate synthase, partial [Alphaproteobacteria bacterium]
SDRLLHGEAVAIGMALAFRFSQELDYCPAQEAERAISHLRAVGLPVSIAEIPGARPDAGTLMELIAQDKKVKDGVPAFILVRAIGEAFIDRSVPMDRLEKFLTRMCDLK